MASSGIVEKRVKETRKGFNLKRWKELYNEPPKVLTKYDGTPFHVDEDCFRKYLQYVYDMVFKNLDVFGLFGGIEGSGKTTDASQVGQQFYFILCQCNVLREDLGTWYEYNEENCLAHNLQAFLDLCDKYNDDLWRIIICDEAGDLKGENRWEEGNKEFRDDMRKDRKKLRIRLMCYPQPFELVKDFTLGRTNFIRLNEFSLDKNGFGSIPNVVNMVVLPRGKYTYSFNTKELIKQNEMKKAILELTKERYTNELDPKYIFKTCKKDDVFCFNAETYIKKAKEENRSKRKEKKIFITDTVAEILAKHLTAGKLGLSVIPVDKSLPKEEREEREEERRAGLQINKLKEKCKEQMKKLGKESL